MQGSNRTALLLFSRTAADEAKAKAFVAASHAVNTEVARLLIQKTIQTARQAGLPLYTDYSDTQVKGCFGERLADAVERVFEDGYEQVIVIGNDNPGMSADDLHLACTSLIEHGLVLGPNNDGGVYLIGMNRQYYNRSKFLSLPWASADLKPAWQAYAGNTAIYWLRPLNDIDNRHDFSLWFRRLLPTSGLRTRVLRILFLSTSKPLGTGCYYTHLIPQSGTWLRGPPTHLSSFLLISY